MIVREKPFLSAPWIFLCTCPTAVSTLSLGLRSICSKISNSSQEDKLYLWLQVTLKDSTGSLAATETLNMSLSILTSASCSLRSNFPLCCAFLSANLLSLLWKKLHLYWNDHLYKMRETKK